MEESQQLQFPIRGNNNNKPLNVSGGNDGSGQFTDSGYTSYHSISASGSVARSVLATIEEDNEADSSFEEARSSEDIFQMGGGSNVLTPTTAASIERISNFHLTTPNSTGKPVGQHRGLVRKPTFDNLFEQYTPKKADYGPPCRTTQTPVRSDRKVELGSQTPRKNKASAKRKLGEFREKLYSDGDALELAPSRDLNDSLEGDCKKLDQEDISPIYHTKRRRSSVIDLIRSSTPKTASLRSNFHVEVRENIDWDAVQQGKASGRGGKSRALRKFQSFSPSKMHSYKKRDVLQEKSVIANRRAPFQRQDALRQVSLEQDLSKQSTPQKAQESSLDKSFELPLEGLITPSKQSNLGVLLDAPILVQPSSEADFKESDLEQQISQIPSFEECAYPQTPSKQTLSLDDSGVIRHAPVCTEVNKSIPSILGTESPSFVSLSIPKTPTSTNKSRNRLKRLSSTKKDKPRSKPPSPIHRAQPFIPGTYRRPSYVNVERLNILKWLNEHDKDALGIVLDYLNDSDLVRVVRVSTGWRDIIEHHRPSYRRLRAHFAREKEVKENLSFPSFVSREGSLLGKTGGSLLSSFGDSSKEIAVSLPRQPFSLCNSIDSNQSVGGELRRSGSVQRSPPVSPSKRKFRENQKIASHLKKSERLKPCPRCEKPSRVVLTKSSIKLAMATGSLDSSTTRTVASGKLDRSYTLPDSLMGSSATSMIAAAALDCTSTTIGSPQSPTNPDRIRRNLFSTSLLPRSQSVDARTPVTRSPRRRRSTDVQGSSASLLERKNGKTKSAEAIQCDYAVCSGKNCGFMFCIKCLCEYHPSSVCKDLAPNSPSKEDEPAHNVACSKQSRRSLLRLRK
ncbi:AAEL012336-PA [Aedes aegypti]|uniref:AAEL012336-PA n=1 Tax=Aedes aegypti TaxID=7159 RepID=Q16ME2_AEDAE|nr:AAEL012336-PA [Aedes aegypti]